MRTFQLHYLGKAALSNKNHGVPEPIIIKILKDKNPITLTSVASITLSPLLNSNSKMIGMMVMVSDEIRKYKIPISDLHLINWLIEMVGLESSNTYIKEVMYNSNSNLISSVFYEIQCNQCYLQTSIHYQREKHH